MNLKTTIFQAREDIHALVLQDTRDALTGLSILVDHYFSELDKLRNCVECALKVSSDHSRVHHQTVAGLERHLRDLCS